MKIRYISEDEVTIDIPLADLDLIDAAILDQYKTVGTSPRYNEIVRQFSALRVLVKAHTEGSPA